MLISKVDDPRRIFDFINLEEVVECELKADSADNSHARVAARQLFLKSALYVEVDHDFYLFLQNQQLAQRYIPIWVLDIGRMCHSMLGH